MSIDLNKIPPRYRKRLIEIGERFSSERTLAQANSTLNALESNKKAIESHGYMTKDIQILTYARNELRSTLTGRDDARGAKRTSSKSYQDTMLKGKNMRRQGRSILRGLGRDLAWSEDADDLKAATDLEQVMDSTSTTPDKAEALARQLQQIGQVLSGKQIASLAKTRNGEEVLKQINAAVKGLQDASENRNLRPGTPEYAERLDLLDGLIVEQVRHARQAAESAAKETAQPALLNAFALDSLY